MYSLPLLLATRRGPINLVCKRVGANCLRQETRTKLPAGGSYLIADRGSYLIADVIEKFLRHIGT
jgi:hypothetical protein